MAEGFVRNGWYATAWSEEVTRAPIERWVTGIPMVLYRKEDGAAAVLEGTCPHRGAPLALGRLRGDDIECGYHGIKFDCKGACVAVPQQQRVPTVMRVRAFPFIERGGLIWSWPGDPAKADPALCYEHWLADPALGSAQVTRVVEARHSLLVDNLMDLSHETYLHDDSIGDENVTTVPLETTVFDDHISSKRTMRNIDPPPFFQKVGGLTGKIDRSQTAEFWAPGLCLTLGLGEPQSPGQSPFAYTVIHCLTPETATRTRYYLATAYPREVCKRSGISEADLNKMMVQVIARVLDQDTGMLHATEKHLQNIPPDLVERSIACDTGGLAARKLFAARLKMEHEPAAA